MNGHVLHNGLKQFMEDHFYIDAPLFTQDIFLNINAVMKQKVEAICTVLTVKNLHFGFTSSKRLGMLTSELYILCI